MMSGPPLWCVRHDGNLWRYSEGAWVEWDGEDGFGHELVQPIQAFRPRLNPVCPVCGEDEPEMYLWDEYAPESIGKRVVRIGSKLGCKCCRCGWTWEVEPLSKPWEEGGGA